MTIKQIQTELQQLCGKKIISFRHKGKYGFAQFESDDIAREAKSALEEQTNKRQGFDFRVQFARSQMV